MINKFILISALTVFSFASNGQTIGIYVNVDEPNKELLLENSRFVFRNRSQQNALPLFYCSDTIAFGRWSVLKDKNIIELSSNDQKLNSFTNIRVRESKDSTIRGTKFLITNPIESHQAKVLEYGLDIGSDCSEFQSEVSSEKFQSNCFLIKVPRNCTLTSFSVYVYPANFLIGWQEQYPSVTHSLSYKIENTGSNVFEVSCPDLTYCYLNSMKLKEDYVLIVNKDLLKWNGQLYKRKK